MFGRTEHCNASARAAADFVQEFGRAGQQNPVGPRFPKAIYTRAIATLQRRGVQVIPIPYDEIHHNGGGIHCSTMELLREPA